MPGPQEFRRTTTPFLAGALLVVGVALTVRMALLGKPIGIVLGVLFMAAGAGRLYVARKMG